MINDTLPRLTWRWVIILSALLVALAIAYGVLHGHNTRAGTGRERVSLEKEDVDLLRRVLEVTDTSGAPNQPRLMADHPAREAFVGILDTRLPKWAMDDRAAKLKVMDALRPADALSYVSITRFEVRSFFWLTGWPAVMELVFWTLFGSLCSLLYNIYDVRRRNAIENRETTDGAERGFDASEMPNHLAKLVFSPFVSIVVIFGYKYIAEDDSKGVLETSSGVVIMSFLLGFYSARAMRMLDRIKDVLLPYDNKPAEPASEPKPMNRARAVIALSLDPSVVSAHPQDVEELQAELRSATVTLLPEGGGEAVAAVLDAEEEEARFVAHIENGRYAVKAICACSTGLNLVGESVLEMPGDGTVPLQLKADETQG
jgi:hypothetical protein